MSKSSIVDFQVKVVPSEKLVEFLVKLGDVQSAPENVLAILKANGVDVDNIKVFSDEIKPEVYTKEENTFLKSVKLEAKDVDELSVGSSLDLDIEEEEEEEKDDKKAQHLTLDDLKWVNKLATEKRATDEDTPHLHTLLRGSKLILPKNEHIPRNPELEARCKKLRQQQENRAYRNITKDVDAVRRTLPEDTIAYQMKAINSQIIAVLQFIFSVIAGFAFGFIGVELIVGNLDFGFRLLLGIICALTIALAEIYFLAKKLNEIDNIPTEADLVPPPQNQRKPHND